MNPERTVIAVLLVFTGMILVSYSFYSTVGEVHTVHVVFSLENDYTFYIVVECRPGDSVCVSAPQEIEVRMTNVTRDGNVAEASTVNITLSYPERKYFETDIWVGLIYKNPRRGYLWFYPIGVVLMSVGIFLLARMVPKKRYYLVPVPARDKAAFIAFVSSGVVICLVISAGPSVEETWFLPAMILSGLVLGYTGVFPMDMRSPGGRWFLWACFSMFYMVPHAVVVNLFAGEHMLAETIHGDMSSFHQMEELRLSIFNALVIDCSILAAIFLATAFFSVRSLEKMLEPRVGQEELLLLAKKGKIEEYFRELRDINRYAAAALYFMLKDFISTGKSRWTLHSLITEHKEKLTFKMYQDPKFLPSLRMSGIVEIEGTRTYIIRLVDSPLLHKIAGEFARHDPKIAAGIPQLKSRKSRENTRSSQINEH